MILKMLQGHYLDVMEAKTADDFRQQVIRFTRHLGFETVVAMTVVDHSPTHTDFHVVGNTPDAYQEISHDLAGARLDPVMQHCKYSPLPILWNQDTYVSKGRGALWEQQAYHGIKTGLALALHLPYGQHFFLGVDRDKPLPKNPKIMTRAVADLQLFAVHAHTSAIRVFAPWETKNDVSASLTPRELEALRWTMEGKSAREVGDTLNISERTAIFHLQNATRKLGSKSKFQAVLKAIRLGLLA